jgi:hypothetical protein
MIDTTDHETNKALTELRQYVAKLSLISHVAGTSYDAKTARSTSESIGGNRPPGGDMDRPCRPRADVGEQAWVAYRQELDAWKDSYWRRTPDYFRREFAKCFTVARLCELRDEARDTLKAWRRQPLPLGQEPEYGSPQWKRSVAESREDSGRLADRFNVTRRRINQIRQEYGSIRPGR